MKNQHGIRISDQTHTFKYAPKKSSLTNSFGKPRRMFPDNWISGPDVLTHDMYYAWLKHRSQARYRKEAYELTWADWQTIWANPVDFLNRGRRPEDLTLTRRDWDLGWSIGNVDVVTRLEQLRRARDKTMQIRAKK